MFWSYHNLIFVFIIDFKVTEVLFSEIIITLFFIIISRGVETV